MPTQLPNPLRPADRPGALEEARLAEEKARREWIWQTTFGKVLCPHGHPGGNIPHPVDGHLACVECRCAAREDHQQIQRPA